LQLGAPSRAAAASCEVRHQIPHALPKIPQALQLLVVYVRFCRGGGACRLSCSGSNTPLVGLVLGTSDSRFDLLWGAAELQALVEQLKVYD